VRGGMDQKVRSIIRLKLQTLKSVVFLDRTVMNTSFGSY